ncbi:MAG: Gfo/Idh/MocA family oxidoreductase [Oscillospiraceae bacterium]|nr:Gfo/Idh/MocA family oxidoreductase [Oscillospiraceae bacterium]
MKKLRVGVIGCGGIATNKHLPALAANKELAEAVAFCDIIPERAETLCELHGAKGAKVYEDYRDMLAAGGMDVVHVCTPNRSHAELSIAALEAGCHVLCEKPMAKTAAEARTMLDAAERTGKKLSIGYQNRFRKDSQHVHALCEAGTLGEIYYARAIALRRRAVPTWGVFLKEEEQGGGPLIDIGTHALDLTLWNMNNYEPAMVVGQTFRKLADNDKGTGNAWGDWDAKTYTVEDSAFGFIRMKNGAIISLESSWALNVAESHEAVCLLCGTKGGVDMRDSLRINTVENGNLALQTVSMEAGGVAFFSGVSEPAQDIECRQWLEAVLYDREPLVKPREALVVSEILEAIYTSAKTGKPVYF